jgi:hypothetical protein
MSDNKPIYILNPDGSINFYNIAFWTGLTRMDWSNNPENEQYIAEYGDQLVRPFPKADIEILKTNHGLNMPGEFVEYISKLSREFIIGDFPIKLKYEDLEELAKNHKYKLQIDETNGVQFNIDLVDKEKIEKVMVQIGLLKTGERDWIYLGEGKFKGSIWRSKESEWKVIFSSFRDYILSPFFANLSK